ncbi:hypothetical protein TNCV_4660251 [Trichonephila clavipes]|uniref:Uncharacterized protein n=1 Tax=Trichonephila clavipes TaxID=2585209 RepID=A0A8X6SGL0_TRICX|nr:hypothetical protein TNCV_4660251 [Trichonephila clavipes]
MPTLPLPPDDVVSREFIEFSTLEQVVAIHSGMTVGRAGLVSSQAKPVKVYSPKVLSGAEVQETVDFSEPMNSNPDTEIDDDTLIKDVIFPKALSCLETAKTYLI